MWRGVCEYLCPHGSSPQCRTDRQTVSVGDKWMGICKVNYSHGCLLGQLADNGTMNGSAPAVVLQNCSVGRAFLVPIN